MNTLSKQLGIPDIDEFIDRRVIPMIEETPQSGTARPGRGFHEPGQLDMRGLGKTFEGNFFFKFTAALIVLSVLLSPVMRLMRNGEDPGMASAHIFVIVTTIGAGLIALFFSRDKILSKFTESHFRFIHRNHAMKAICKAAGLEFVGLPGGASEAARKFARWKLCPKTFRDLIESMDDYGGLDDVVEIVRRSGLAMPSGFVIASDKNYERYYQQQFDQQQFEDGFTGKRGGIAFSALEWHEKSQNKVQHHLMIVLELPTRLFGLVEFKNKSESWPMRPRDQKTDSVKLLSSDFHRAFHVRAEDQMEARLIFDPAVIERITEFAHGDPVRGAAFDNYLVFDIAGHNRFNIVDLITGHWSRDSIMRTLEDVAEMLALVDGIAEVFSVKSQHRLPRRSI